MKRLSVLMLSLFVVGLFMTMSSCQKSTGPTNDMFSSTEFQLPVTDNTPSDIQDASETSEFMMLPPTGYSNEDCQFMGWNGSRDGRDGGSDGAGAARTCESHGSRAHADRARSIISASGNGHPDHPAVNAMSSDHRRRVGECYPSAPMMVTVIVLSRSNSRASARMGHQS